MAGINILKIYHGNATEYTWAGTDVAASSITELNCNGYTKLLVHYVCDTDWNRAGSIIMLGSIASGGTYVTPDDTIENSTFTVGATDDTVYTGAGQYYVVEGITPYIKPTWDNSTPGTTGNVTVTVMPFNS